MIFWGPNSDTITHGGIARKLYGFMLTNHFHKKIVLSLAIKFKKLICRYQVKRYVHSKVSNGIFFVNT